MANCVQVTVSFEPNADISDIQSESFFKQITQDLVDTISRLKTLVEKSEIIESIAVKPNLQLVYVSDIERSTDFYKTILNVEPIFSSPRYVAFSVSNEAIFALWSGGAKPDKIAQRFSEIGIMLPSSNDVEQLFEDWKKHPDINIEHELYTDVFGQTFLVKDPDGHIIRVCPLD
ncbi:glyoxalase [Xenorhabdus sp. 12]|uniref:Glyoxalase n=2 Tax=Xenorhabdus santafensis TaxID=2582833 RepID=A0ABU4SAE3_9GAMM|nr:glyoxalase [Xenorhabdus sp. 12]